MMKVNRKKVDKIHRKTMIHSPLRINQKNMKVNHIKPKKAKTVTSRRTYKMIKAKK